MTISTISSVAVVGICRSLAVVTMAVTISMAVSMTITSVSSVAVVGVSISRPLAVVAVVTITAIAIASVARLSSSFWLSNSHSRCLSLPLAIVAMVSIAAIAIARLSSSGSLGFPLAIVSMAVAVTVPTVAIARLCNNHSEEGEGKKGQEFHGVF